MDPLLVPRQFGPEESRRFGWSAVRDPARPEAYETRYWDGQERAVTAGLRGDDSRSIMDRELAEWTASCAASAEANASASPR